MADAGNNNTVPKKKGKMGLALHMTGARWAMVSFGAVGIIGIVLFLLVHGNNASKYQGASVSVTAPGNIHNAPGKSSAAYAKQVNEYNEKNAQSAESKGSSFIGIPVTSVVSSVNIATPKQKTEQQQQQQIKKEMQDYNNQMNEKSQQEAMNRAPSDNELKTEISLVVNSLQNAASPPTIVPVEEYVSSEKSGNLQWGNSHTGSSSADASKKSPKTYSIPIAGDIIYAVMDNTAKSSVNVAPVMATLLQPPFLKEKVLGHFTKPKGVNSLVIQFTTMVLPDGQTVAIDAYATAPKTTLPELSSNVNRHILARTGAFLGSVFLAGVQGYGQALSSQGETVSQGLLGTTTTTAASLTPSQLLGIAAGSAAKDLNPLTQDLNKTLTEPNTVTVNAGTPFDLFVVSGGKTGVK